MAVLAYLLWVEHRAHLAGALPYALMLVCVGVHLLMHRQGPRPGTGGDERP